MRAGSEECQTIESQSVSRISNRPPGRSTRCASVSAAGMSATYSYTWVEVTTSKLRRRTAARCASPVAERDRRGRVSRRRRASASMLLARVDARHAPWRRPRAAISQARKPGPEPMSRTSLARLQVEQVVDCMPMLDDVRGRSRRPRPCGRRCHRTASSCSYRSACHGDRRQSFRGLRNERCERCERRCRSPRVRQGRQPAHRAAGI